LRSDCSTLLQRYSPCTKLAMEWHSESIRVNQSQSESIRATQSHSEPLRATQSHSEPLSNYLHKVGHGGRAALPESVGEDS
jgi:hypothetical protein